MKTSRIFSNEGVTQKKDDYHGGCRYVRTLPDVAAKGVKSVNVELSFEDALKFSLAVQSALMSINKVSRKNRAGKAMGIVLSIKTDNETISVLEKKVGGDNGEE